MCLVTPLLLRGGLSLRGLLPHPAEGWPRPAKGFQAVEECYMGGPCFDTAIHGQICVDGSMKPGPLPELGRAGLEVAAPAAGPNARRNAGTGPHGLVQAEAECTYFSRSFKIVWLARLDVI